MGSKGASVQTLHVGDWVVHPDRGQISSGRSDHRVEPRVMQVLLELARSPGQTVTRDRLMQRVWGDVTVTDDALQRCISILRRTLGRGEHGVRIETIPKIGYRMVLEPSGARPRHWLWLGTGVAVVVALLLWVGGSGAVRPLVSNWMSASTSSPASVRPLTTEPGHEMQPTLSPDGSQVAYVSRSDGRTDLFVRSVQHPAAAIQLTTTSEAEHAPAYAPDGSSIAFARTGAGPCTVHWIAATGGTEHRLFRCAHARETELAWSPDGSHLAYVDRDSPEGPLAVHFFAVSGPALEAPPPPEGGIGDGDVSFSPDGRTLAFSRSPALGVEDVYVWDLRSSRLRRVTQTHMKLHGMTHLDADFLLYASNLGGSFGLWKQSVAGGRPTAMRAVGRHQDSPVARAGRVVYEAWSARVDVVSVPEVNGSWRLNVPLDPTLVSTHFDWSPRLANDGRVAFLSDRTGAAELWVAERDGTAPRQLTRFEGPYLQDPTWSPDGTTIAFAAPVEGNFDIFTVDAGGGPPLRITGDPSRDRAPSYSADGRFLYFSSDRGGLFRLWRMPSAGGEATVLWTGRQAVEHRGWMYYTKSRSDGLFRRRLGSRDDESNSETVVVPELTPVDQNNWFVDGDNVVFVHRPSPSHPQLVQQSLSTGVRVQIGDLPRFYHTSGVALGPDRRLWFAQVIRSETDLYVIDLGR
ncbi:MAG: winged helix-turn-helix domain-containing protein [Myxococcota bacterium]